MDNIMRSIANMHPENVLKRGYSITLINGKAITHVREVKNSDTLETILAEGTLLSEVKSIKNQDPL